MLQLPCEIILNIQNILIQNRELRAYANICKALNWPIDVKYFECELRNHRHLNYNHEDYDKKMIELWDRAGIDDGVPAEYLKKHLNKKTRLFKTMWALNLCSGEFFDIIKWYNHNDYVKYTYNIIQDTRTFNKYYKYKKHNKYGLCQKCREKYITDINSSHANDLIFEYKNLPVHKDNIDFLEFYKRKHRIT